MTSLELTLANVLASIEQARGAGNSQVLKTLLERKRAICEVLAAPEQSWLEAPVQASSHIPRPRQRSDEALVAA
jgi:flagellar biosynthesis/type III secretory pathway chaperone